MISKSQINKLGKQLRTIILEGDTVGSVELEKLQEYRTSFREDISPVFENVAAVAKKVRGDSLISLRIKRIESILSKIRREPTMALGNMGDIAGCRVICHSKSALSLIRNEISKLYTVTKVKDYVSEPKPDGYKGYHIYIQSPVNKNKQVEIQLRHVRTHKWASLVEIIDIIYDLKLKEGEKHPELQDFLYLLSLEKHNLNISQIARILEIDSKYEIYKKLNQVFIQNHIPIRRSWLSISNIKSYSHFIIEVDKDKKSNIKALENYQTAELKYFQMFLGNQTSNFVLIFIEKPKFKEICIAYASYMMIKHDYLDDWNFFAKKILRTESKLGGIKSYNTFKDFIDRNLHDQQKLINSELDEINNHVGENGDNNGLAIQDWINELTERDRNIEKFINELKQLKPPKEPSFFKRIFK
ncbi:RelA/SpoT domain-containing protein [uncultured Marivirga sp.]|uniref:RelA/SpoT domain-containing protein n=1 Tax=uncultured Marivirga sp. TaxID=1123707 RepID=UPI0030ED37EF|tara:strand:+ start:23343 stop:24584 length:1242 start_codon:yes stop_codon:yes gene_type:complete